MNKIDLSAREILLDQEFNRAIDQLRTQAYETFSKDMGEIRKLSELLASWNEDLLKEVEDTVARYEALRSQLSAKMLTASTVAAGDRSLVMDATNRMAQESHSIEKFHQHLNFEPGIVSATRRSVG